MMNYLLKINDRFYYNRRVPAIFKPYDSRPFIRFALNTDSRKEALRLAFLHNEKVENYWKQLIHSSTQQNSCNHDELITATRLLAFTNNTPIISNEKETIVVDCSSGVNTNSTAVSLSEAMDLFWDFAKDKTYNKSENQIRKWKNPRQRAMSNFISCIGDKKITDVCRPDILQFRDWWLARLQKENLVENSANKNFIQLKTIFQTININLNLNINIGHLFADLVLGEDNDYGKLPFTSNHIVSKLFTSESLAGLNTEARSVLYAMSETGAGLTELVNLTPEEIVLHAEIPHISITRRQGNKLKTKFRKRAIPIVGFALDAFKECPTGFKNYYDRPDALSSTLNKYLREKGLMPTENHTVNSLRHSFQDRLLRVNAPDRVQADLMGHKFLRPGYGEGACLEHKLEWLQKIQLKKE